MRVWRPLAMKSATNQRKEHMGNKSVAIFIRLLAVASQICEIPRNSTKIRTYSNSSRSSKVIDLGVSRKRICNFLLVTNSNHGRISYRCRDIDAFSSKIACFFHPTIAWRPLAEEGLAVSTYSIHGWKVYLTGYNSVADITGLSSFV